MTLGYFFNYNCNRLQLVSAGVYMKMDDIAKLAGVSKASISRVLNNKPNISDALREKVEAVLKTYDYQPNLMAQALNTNQTKLIGVLLPAIGLDIFSDIVHGISDILREQGYELILADSKGHIDQAKKYLEIFKSKQVDGVIYFPTVFSPEHIAYINRIKIPTIILGQCHNGLEKPSVAFPDVEASKKIVNYLYGLGCKKIVHIAMPKNHIIGELREQGYREAMIALNLDPRVIYVNDLSYDSGYATGQKITEADALFVAMDRLAIGALRYLLENNKKDILVAGIDNMEVSSMISPSLTSIDFDYYLGGQSSGQMVLELIKGNDVVSKQLSYQLIERESTRRQHV